MSDNVEYEVTYPMGFVVSVPRGATTKEIIEAYVECVEDWVQDGNMPAEEYVEIEPLAPNPPLLEHHLQHNFNPPYDLRLLPYVRTAIEKANAGEWDDEITIEGDGGSMTVTVAKMVDDFHLHDFIDA